VPELPEVELYLDALDRFLKNRTLQRVRVRSPSLLRTFEPPLSAAEGRRVLGFRRLGKRVVWEMEGDLFLVFHLMISGRFHWRKPGAALQRKRGTHAERGSHAAFDFEHGTLLLTEAATHKRASLHVIQGEGGLAEHDPGGLEPLGSTLTAFRTALLTENRTLKRALTDPRIFAGIGNAHSDEILLEAQLSPVRLTRQLEADEIKRLWRATRANLKTWSKRLVEETGDAFPEKVTAFHPAMGAHGKYGQPCPRCGTPIQRIVFADRETNYCPTCQTGGKLLADRGLSRLLREDWPRTLEELEELRRK
jgi:formamidopyrimidine-DNA glycosylase